MIETKKKTKIIDYESLKKELEKLRHYLDYKNARFCKKCLENIIKENFGDKHE